MYYAGFRLFLPLFFCCTGLAGLQAQWVCFSDSTTIYEFPLTDLTPLVGAATFQSGQFRVVVGGRFQDAQAPDSTGAYNCDMLVVDDSAAKMYVLPLSYFPPYVADQFGGFHYCYTQDRDTAYLLGGYGYDLGEGYEATFPTLTIFPVKTLIDSVINHRDYLNLFAAIDDERLAVTGGTLLHVGAYFLVYGGKEASVIREEYSDCLTLTEWDFKGQLRKFRLSAPDGYPQVDEFQICNTEKVFYQCMPANWRGTPSKVLEMEW